MIKVDNTHNGRSVSQSQTSDDLASALRAFDAVIFDFDGTLADTSEQIISVASSAQPLWA